MQSDAKFTLSDKSEQEAELSCSISEQLLVDTLLRTFADQLTMHDAKPNKSFETNRKRMLNRLRCIINLNNS